MKRVIKLSLVTLSFALLLVYFHLSTNTNTNTNLFAQSNPSAGNAFGAEAAASAGVADDGGDDSIIAAEEETAAADKDFEVPVGMDKVFKINFVPYTKLQIGNSAILEYVLVPQKKEIIFKGIKPGETSVIVRNSVGDIKLNLKVKVTSSSQSQVVQELKEFLGDIEGLEIGIKGGKVYLGGEIVVPNDIGRISVIMDGYRDVLQLYELSPHTERMIIDKMQNEMRKNGLKDVTVRIVNRVYWLEGMVSKESDKELAERIVAGLMPPRIAALADRAGRMQQVQGRGGPIQNFIGVNEQQKKPDPPPKMIQIIAQFVELTKDYNKIFGFKWTPSLATGGGQIQFGKTNTNGVTTQSNGTFSGTIGNLFPQLASAKSAGYARVIQQGMIIVKDKRPNAVSIRKQSSIPIVLGTGEFQKAVNVTVGYNLSIKASTVGKDKVAMDVNVGVTTPHGVNGNTTNSLDTSVVVGSDESAVLGGISVNETQTHYDKDPPFGDDKVQAAEGGGQSFPLFSFLRSKSYALIKTQFVVFVTPKIIESAATATGEIKRKFKQKKK
ncbi:MAG: pilus assembly protein N-terminal domain-containing protein [Oligoflexia bacterium]|nr:pilus assembly protein N-terminal domain-containing protein [Oligoflexia bacterium]